jgi:pyruvate/2-oxoglutarate dehydrogenase complex dihydrolipoamide dehydrogenase (E3) component
MSGPERYDVLVLGSGTGATWMATTIAQEGMRTAVIERGDIGGGA